MHFIHAMTSQVSGFPRLQKLHSHVFSYQKEKSEGLEKLPTPKGLVLGSFLIGKTTFHYSLGQRYINQKQTVEMRTQVINVKQNKKNHRSSTKTWNSCDAQCSDNIHCGGLLQQTELWDRNRSFFHTCKVHLCPLCPCTVDPPHACFSCQQV